MIIYVITNKINGKQYVGQTIQTLKKRISFHLSRASGCLALKAAIEKYGKENFEIKEIAKTDNLTDLCALEKEFIYGLNTLAPNGYNLTTGGERPTYSEETRKKMSDMKKGYIPWNKGMGKGPYKKKNTRPKHHTEAHKLAISNGHKKTKILCKTNGKIYSSIMEASRELILNSGNIHQVISKKKAHVKGYIFEKIEG